MIVAVSAVSGDVPVPDRPQAALFTVSAGRQTCSGASVRFVATFRRRQAAPTGTASSTHRSGAMPAPASPPIAGVRRTTTRRGALRSRRPIASPSRSLDIGNRPSALPDQRTLRSQPIPGAQRQASSRHSCRERNNRGPQRSGRCRRHKTAQNQGHNRYCKVQEQHIHDSTISQAAVPADPHGEKRPRGAIRSTTTASPQPARRAAQPAYHGSFVARSTPAYRSPRKPAGWRTARSSHARPPFTDPGTAARRGDVAPRHRSPLRAGPSRLVPRTLRAAFPPNPDQQLPRTQSAPMPGRRPPVSPEPTQPDRRADEGETPLELPHQATAPRRCRAVPGRPRPAPASQPARSCTPQTPAPRVSAPFPGACAHGAGGDTEMTASRRHPARTIRTDSAPRAGGRNAVPRAPSLALFYFPSGRGRQVARTSLPASHAPQPYNLRNTECPLPRSSVGCTAAHSVLLDIIPTATMSDTETAQFSHVSTAPPPSLRSRKPPESRQSCADCRFSPDLRPLFAGPGASTGAPRPRNAAARFVQVVDFSRPGSFDDPLPPQRCD